MCDSSQFFNIPILLYDVMIVNITDYRDLWLLLESEFKQVSHGYLILGLWVDIVVMMYSANSV